MNTWFNHMGVVNADESGAMRFYRDFLGMKNTRQFTVARELSEQLFATAREIEVLVFEKEGLKFEVFICAECSRPQPDFSHFGLFVDDLQEFLRRGKSSGVEIIIGSHGGKTVYFVKDFSGNLIEVKEGQVKP